MIVSLRPDAVETLTLPDGRGGHVVSVDGALPPDAKNRRGIAAVQGTHTPYMLASREHRAPTVLGVGEIRIGRPPPILMAGPRVVEGRESLIEAVRAVKSAGVHLIRGRANRPRTSPYAFQGLGEKVLRCQRARSGRGAGRPRNLVYRGRPAYPGLKPQRRARVSIQAVLPRLRTCRSRAPIGASPKSAARRAQS